MAKNLKIMAALTAMLFIVACNDENNSYFGDYGNIKIPDTRQLEQQITANPTHATGVTFTAEDTWSATIAEVRSEALDWIAVSPTHGEAGTYTLRIELQPNSSTQSRSAVITLTCGDSRVGITISQDVAEIGFGPSDLRIVGIDRFKLSAADGKKIVDQRYEIEYDAESRISKFYVYDGEDNLERTTIINYPNSSTITMTTQQWDIGTITHTAQLESGRIISISRNRQESTNNFTFEYDNQGYCISQTNTAAGSSDETTSITWRDGNITFFDFNTYNDLSVNYTSHKNSSSPKTLDLNALLYHISPCNGCDDRMIDLLAAMRLFGNSCQNLTNVADIYAYNIRIDKEWIYYVDIEQHIDWKFDEGRISETIIEDYITPMKKNQETGEVMQNGESYTDKYITYLRWGR